MSVTPQTNTTLEEIAEAICKRDNFCICGHVSPDGDCIGSQLALRLALLRLGKQVSVLLASDDPIDESFTFLPGSDALIYAGDFDGVCDTFISVDVPNENRLMEAASAIKSKASLTVTLDHHAAPRRMSDLSYTDPDSASTSIIIWDLIKLMGVKPDAEIATCAYSGLITDTGRFQHQNTDARAFESACEMVKAGANPTAASEQFFQRRTVASLKLEALTIEHMELLCYGQVALSWVSRRDMQETGAVKSDCEPLVNILRSIDGVRVCCMLREEQDSVRGSLRAKDDTDVAKIAEHFSGGGHKAAAGFTMHCPLDMACAKVSKAIKSALAKVAS